MNTFEKIESIRKKRGSIAVALIDPDKQFDGKLDKMVNLINECDFDIIFVGGSIIVDDRFSNRLEHIKKKSSLPLIIFPGSSAQISEHADAILYLSLISGRNPQYLIDEHVHSAPLIYSLSIETIPTAYILLEGGNQSSVEVASNTKPIEMDQHDTILAHSLAGQYLGKSLLFLECGSGAIRHAACEVINYIKPHLQIPLIVGGGIRTPKSANMLVNAGVDYVVIGTKIEELPDSVELKELTAAIHQI